MDYNEAFDAHRTHTKHAMKTMRDGIRLVGLLYLPFSPRVWGRGRGERTTGDRERERTRKMQEEDGSGPWILYILMENPITMFEVG